MDEYPTLTTLAVFGAVFGAQVLGETVGIGSAFFALALPFAENPWTLVVSVYAHAGVGHLVANTLALMVVGPLVSYVTTPVRFHAFFVGSGAIAGVTQVVVSAPFGGAAVIGASGAIFGFLGYLLVGNRASERTLSWLPLGFTGRVALFAGVAILVTLATATPGVALVAHFAGFLVGAFAGRYRLLHAESVRSPTHG